MDWETIYNGLISNQAGGQTPRFVMQKKEPASPTPSPTHMHLCLAQLSVGSGQLEMANWPPTSSSILREERGAKGQLGSGPGPRAEGIVEGNGSASPGCWWQTWHPDGPREVGDGG